MDDGDAPAPFDRDPDERAHITDPRARRLANQITEAQRREIAEMERLIADLEHR